MIVARKISTKPYVCKCDRELPDKEQTKFMLQTLTARDVAEFQDKLLSTGTASFSATAMQDLLKKALVGWNNFQNDEGGVVKFNAKSTDANLDLLPSEIISELYEAVMKDNFPDPDGEMEKNS